MSLNYAQVVAVHPRDGTRMGEVSVWGVRREVPLYLVPEAQPGKTVLVCDGVAIGKVEDEVLAQASPPVSAPGLPPGESECIGSATLPELAGGDACVTLKGAIDVSGSTR